MTISTVPTVFSVSRLNQSVRLLLEQHMGKIWLSAEISNFSQPSSGHWYFTLKDDKAQIRCAMFRGQNNRVGFRPQNGQHVLVKASITLYEPRGDYQLVVDNLQPAGEGLLQQQFEQLKTKLSAEGLFDPRHKRGLPTPAKCVGIITSATGAALHDILTILQRRDPALPIIIYPTAVQGNEAPVRIVRAIMLANARQECDVLIIGRGGGSLEDLWAFNDERVARAIFSSQLPIISAVGHETDVTIADFVADLRAPTPSAAAELVSRNRLELLRQLHTQQQRLEMAFDYFLAHCHKRFTLIHHRLQQQHPLLRLAHQKARFTALRQHLITLFDNQLHLSIQKIHYQQKRLWTQTPSAKIQLGQKQLTHFTFQLKQYLNQKLNDQQHLFAVACSQLNTVSPLATLSRGYSISETATGQVLKTTKQAHIGEILHTRLKDGWLESEVIKVEKLTKPRKTKEKQE